jgi:hypothetical protein
MDKLIAELEGRLGLFQSKTDADRLRRTIAALRASAERERELIEALEQIKADSDAFYGDHNLWDGGYESGLEHCAEIARAILEKHKEKA